MFGFKKRKKEAGYFIDWINPDGSPGGKVSSRAIVDPSVIVKPHAIVTQGAVIGPDNIIENGEIATAEGFAINFDSKRPGNGFRNLSPSPKL